jgi:hypothetical protein
VELDVERVRHYPGGRWLKIAPRPVELAVPASASIPAELVGDVARSTRRGFRASVAVTAQTVEARATADAIVSATGVLKLGRLAPTR